MARIMARTMARIMARIITSLFLYIILSAANLPRDDDDLVLAWVKHFYPWLALEHIMVVTSIILAWCAAYFIGIMKFPSVDPVAWVFAGVVGQGAVVTIIFSIVWKHNNFLVLV